mgnify:CR=1 FL=1|jgi:hypothetical protein
MSGDFLIKYVKTHRQYLIFAVLAFLWGYTHFSGLVATACLIGLIASAGLYVFL